MSYKIAAEDVRVGDVIRFKPIGKSNQTTVRVVHVKQAGGRIHILAYHYRTDSHSMYGKDHAYILPSTVEHLS